MKKVLVLPVLALFLIASIAMVSAVACEDRTMIAGKIYDSTNFETANPVSGATVNVTCNGIEKTDISQSDGTYSVEYNASDGCCGSITASAYAEKEGVKSNTQTAKIQDYTEFFDLYLGVINIALIPEFGFFVGALTLLSAVGVFFLVRKK